MKKFLSPEKITWSMCRVDKITFSWEGSCILAKLIALYKNQLGAALFRRLGFRLLVYVRRNFTRSFYTRTKYQRKKAKTGSNNGYIADLSSE